MRIRFTGAIVALAGAAVVTLTVMPIAGQAPQGGRAGGRGAGAAAPAAPAAQAARGAAPARVARIAGKPNMNGIWQAMGSANWNLEDHSASATQFWQLGAIGAIPAGQSVIVDPANGTIPVHAGGAEEARGAARRMAEERSGSQVLHGRHSALELHALSVPDRPGPEGHPVRVRVRELEPHRAHVEPHRGAGGQLDGLVERQVGRRHAGHHRERLQRFDAGSIARATTTPSRSTSKSATRCRARTRSSTKPR